VSGSTAVTLSIMLSTARAGEPVFGSRIASIVATTSAAVKGEPSWNLTFGRSLNVKTRAAFSPLHSSASSGCGAMLRSSLVRPE
jgi:hypothetical protein